MMQAVHSSLCLNRVFLYGWLTAAGVPCDFASVAGEHVGFPVKCPGLQPVMGQGSPTSHCADFLRDACSCCLHARATHATEQHEALVCVCVCVCWQCQGCAVPLQAVCVGRAVLVLAASRFLYTGQCSRKHSSSFLPSAAFLCLPLASRVGVVHHQLHCLPACTAAVLQRAITATGSPVQSEWRATRAGCPQYACNVHIM